MEKAIASRKASVGNRRRKRSKPLPASQLLAPSLQLLYTVVAEHLFADLFSDPPAMTTGTVLKVRRETFPKERLRIGTHSCLEVRLLASITVQR
jgi:hypothetical protein